MQDARSMRPLMLLAPMLLAASGCVSSPPISAASSSCSTLVPSSWAEGVGHAPPPAQSADTLAQLKEWIRFGTAEAAQVEKADGRYNDALGIVSRCEQRDRQAVDRSRRGFLGL